MSGDDTPPVAPEPTPGQILTSGVLYRRIYPHRSYFNPEDRRPTSQVFDKGPDPHLSTALQPLTTEAKMLEGTPGFGLCEFDVAAASALGLTVTFDPTSEDPAHVKVEGPLGKSVRRALADSKVSRVLIDPTLPG